MKYIPHMNTFLLLENSSVRVLAQSSLQHFSSWCVSLRATHLRHTSELVVYEWRWEMAMSLDYIKDKNREMHPNEPKLEGIFNR